MRTLTRAMGIPGFMEPSELEWLAFQAMTRSSIAELGSYRGRSTRALADHTGGSVWAVDTWKGSKELEPLLRSHANGWLLEEFQKNISGLENVTVIQADTVKAADLMRGEGRTFDMIFIDADHTYDSVRADISAWLPLLAPGGLFSGHDYDFEDVKRAVHELLPSPGKLLVYNRIWSMLGVK